MVRDISIKESSCRKRSGLGYTEHSRFILAVINQSISVRGVSDTRLLTADP